VVLGRLLRVPTLGPVPVLLALLSSVLWGTSDFLGGTATRRLPGASVVLVSQFVALLGLLPVAALTGAFTTPTSYVLPAVLAGLIGTTALGAFYNALATGTMGVVSRSRSGWLRARAPVDCSCSGSWSRWRGSCWPAGRS